MTHGSVQALVLTLVLVAATAARADGFLSRRVEYHDWNEERVLATAKTQDKPVLMLFHKTWCGACKQLRAKVEKSAEFEALARHFVMANVEDDDEPADEKYSPQGSYSPRVMFLQPDGAVADVVNEFGSDPGHLHFYGTADELVRGMLAALRVVKGIEDVDEL